MATISQDKKTGPATLTILHLCGHKWCMNGDHLAIGTKVLNDQQTACHRGLQSASTAAQYGAIQENYCQHPQKCWTICYQGAFAGHHAWAEM